MVCARCVRRTQLLVALAGHFDHVHARHGLVGEVFGLDDDQLVAALAPGTDHSRLLERAPMHDPTIRSAVCRHGAAYPPALADLTGPPAVLFTSSIRRLHALTEGPAVAIVGARRASSYGLAVARSLGRDLSAAGVTVVSGMALGIDSAAHEGALDSGARTIAVLGGGIDVPYPRSKRQLHSRLTERGALVSEMPPGFRPRKWSFPARNRIIAGLSALTVVVEASERSGALITARAARELGRDVGAVPGRITSPLALGTNDLLRDGAHLIDGAQAVLDVLFGVGMRHAPRASETEGELTSGLAAVLRAVREGRETVSELSASGDAAEVLAALAELELRGFVRRGAGGVYVALP
jgi:DNA processing protein